MQYIFNEEQEQVRQSVRRFLQDKAPVSAARRVMGCEEGFDRRLWREMAGQIGLQGLTIDGEFGGSGYGFVELALTLEEMGRVVYAGPFFSTVVMAANAVANSGDRSAMGDILPGIAAGATLATLASTEAAGAWNLASIQMRAERGDAGYRLTGEKLFVLDGMVADLILVAARTRRGLSLFAVDAGATGLTRTAMRTLDTTRRQARLIFSDTPGRLIGEEGGAESGLSRTLDHISVALAAEQIGGAQQCLDMSVAYAKERVQFGRPIGAFQAVKHKCADILMEVELAKSAAYCAAEAVADESPDVPAMASLAKAYSSDAFAFAATENIHIHGGIGFTWEHDAQLFYKRAKSSQLMFGDASYHRELLAQRIGLGS
jgi:alkylation response protein AidB-like acyl-CoA dehydrogenase